MVPGMNAVRLLVVYREVARRVLDHRRANWSADFESPPGDPQIAIGQTRPMNSLPLPADMPGATGR